MEITYVKWIDLGAGPRWLIPPDLTPDLRAATARLRAAVPTDPDLVWAFSSGTSGRHVLKVLGLTREGILSSAAAVNAHLRSTAADRWLLAIPTHHVGGFAIAARAFLSGAAVDVLPRWRPDDFAAAGAGHRTTLCSLVPTQIFDLVRASLRAPADLRAIVVGGGALDPALFAAARALGWPVLPSYGLTETASQVATAALDPHHAEFPDLTVLDHAEVQIDPAGSIRVRASSLAVYRAVISADGAVTVDDPRDQGWLVTEDLGELHHGRLRVLGRRDDVVKILGELVSIPRVEAELLAGSPGAAHLTVVAIPDARRGHDLVAVTDQTNSLREAARRVDAHNRAAPGPRRIERLAWVPEIPRTALGKVKRAALLAALRPR